MKDWREELNRIAVEFWCGVGVLEDLPIVADAANHELGEAHAEIWDFYGCTSIERAAELTLRLARELNEFVPESWEALPYAQAALRRMLTEFVAQEVSVQVLCKLIEQLDSTFNIYLSGVPQPDHTQDRGEWWMGNLWNNCDWCDGSWTYESCPSLVAEAHRVSKLLSENSVREG